MCPRDPCPHPRGSPERIECYRQRLELGIDLYQPGDSDDIVPLPNAGCAPPPRQGRVFTSPVRMQQERL